MADNNQLNAEMYNMIKQFNSQRDQGLICDTACQNNQNIRNWQSKVTQKETTLANASQNLLNAQRELASYDSSYRPTFNTNINTMADKEMQKLQDNFDDAKQSILQNLDFYDTQIAFKNSMQNISEYQQNKLNDVSGNVARNAGDTAVNQRLATFYLKETNLLDLTLSYLKIIYWTLFVIQVIAAVMLLQGKNVNRGFIILGIVILAIFPLYNTFLPYLQKTFEIMKLFPTP